jgi:hypothetical protein
MDQIGPVTFRIYAYSAEGSLGTFRLGIDASSANASLPANLEISGDLSPVAVPEPMTLTRLAVGAGGLLMRRSRMRCS